MKVAVVYDSVFGNTKQVAEAIGEQLKADGNEVLLLNLRTDNVKQIEADVMFIGGPTRMKHLTRKVKGFVKKLDKDHWSTRPIFVFDTYGPPPKTEEEKRRQETWINPGSAGETQALLAKRGLKVHPTALRSPVTGLKGPLDPDALGKAKHYAHECLATLRK